MSAPALRWNLQRRGVQSGRAAAAWVVTGRVLTSFLGTSQSSQSSETAFLPRRNLLPLWPKRAAKPLLTSEEGRLQEETILTAVFAYFPFSSLGGSETGRMVWGCGEKKQDLALSPRLSWA